MSNVLVDVLKCNAGNFAIRPNSGDLVVNMNESE